MMINKIKKFGNLQIKQKLIVIESSAILFIIKLLIKIVGLNRTYKMLRILPSLPAKKKISTVYIENLWRLVFATSKTLPFKTKCIEESITLWIILKTRGIKSHLKIGVNKKSSEFCAHAWIEVDGKPVGNSEDIYNNFSEFDYKFFCDKK